jgi:Adenylate and Guanylate cyclase catalytic domain
MLLESIFQSFDAVAKKYRIFKVETIGDCYVGTLSSRCSEDSFGSPANKLTVFAKLSIC